MGRILRWGLLQLCQSLVNGLYRQAARLWCKAKNIHTKNKKLPENKTSNLHSGEKSLLANETNLYPNKL